jgi:hypothetical protein
VPSFANVVKPSRYFKEADGLDEAFRSLVKSFAARVVAHAHEQQTLNKTAAEPLGRRARARRRKSHSITEAARTTPKEEVLRILTEDEVIDAVIRFLKDDGWAIVSRCRASERGEDIVASRNFQRLVVEAKGAGSSKPDTNRYGDEFNKGQVFDHVGKAVLESLRVVGRRDTSAAIALPDNDSHRAEIAQVEDALRKLGISVFWVSVDGVVRLDPMGRSERGEHE